MPAVAVSGAARQGTAAAVLFCPARARGADERRNATVSRRVTAAIRLPEAWSLWTPGAGAGDDRRHLRVMLDCCYSSLLPVERVRFEGIRSLDCHGSLGCCRVQPSCG